MCLVTGGLIIWASQKWDNFSSDVGVYFCSIAVGFSIVGIVLTICDLGKWIFNFFK